MSLSSSQSSPTRSVGVYVIAALFLLVGIAEIVGCVLSIRMLLGNPSGVYRLDWLLAQMAAPMLALPVLNLLAAIAVFMMRREALIFMGCVLGLSLQQMCTAAAFTFVMLIPTLNFVCLCTMIYFSVRLARNGKLL